MLRSVIERAVKNSTLILNEDLYKKAGVTIPLIDVNGELSLLFERRAENIHQAGEISFPGGKFDNDVDTHLKFHPLHDLQLKL